jgi:hypothetical protein
LGYSVVALLIQLLSGGLRTGHGWYTTTHYLGVYLFSGLVGGALWGLLRPLTKTQIGLMVVLSLVGMIFYSTAMYTFLNMNNKPADIGLWLFTELIGIAFGIAVGRKLWKRGERP